MAVVSSSGSKVNFAPAAGNLCDLFGIAPPDRNPAIRLPRVSSHGCDGAAGAHIQGDLHAFFCVEFGLLPGVAMNHPCEGGPDLGTSTCKFEARGYLSFGLELAYKSKIGQVDNNLNSRAVVVCGAGDGGFIHTLGDLSWSSVFAAFACRRRPLQSRNVLCVGHDRRSK